MNTDQRVTIAQLERRVSECGVQEELVDELREQIDSLEEQLAKLQTQVHTPCVVCVHICVCLCCLVGCPFERDLVACCVRIQRIPSL